MQAKMVAWNHLVRIKTSKTCEVMVNLIQVNFDFRDS